MGILIGMDEAGYGPNLGPLVVAATAWEVAEEGSGFRLQGSGGGELAFAGGFSLASAATPNLSVAAPPCLARKVSSTDCVDLYQRLRNIVAKSASARRIAIADSKSLYHPGLGLRQLERGVHAVLLAMRQSLLCWSSLVNYCQADPYGHHQRYCWPEKFVFSLPVDATADELTRLGIRFARACDAAGARPLAIRARLVFPAEFNDLVADHGTKGAALSHVTVGLLRAVVDGLRDGNESGRAFAAASSPSLTLDLRPLPTIFALCDKHGGRNYYAALLQHHFFEQWVEPIFERHAESRYEWGPPEARTRVTFRMNGETFMPTALASMTAKYLRELSMRAFNEFWSARVPGLRPTCGYPVDARRFKKQIAATQRELGIDDHVLWRSR